MSKIENFIMPNHVHPHEFKPITSFSIQVVPPATTSPVTKYMILSLCIIFYESCIELSNL